MHCVFNIIFSDSITEKKLVLHNIVYFLPLLLHGKRAFDHSQYCKWSRTCSIFYLFFLFICIFEQLKRALTFLSTSFESMISEDHRNVLTRLNMNFISNNLNWNFEITDKILSVIKLLTYILLCTDKSSENDESERGDLVVESIDPVSIGPSVYC